MWVALWMVVVLVRGLQGVEDNIWPLGGGGAGSQAGGKGSCGVGSPGKCESKDRG